MKDRNLMVERICYEVCHSANLGCQVPSKPFQVRSGIVLSLEWNMTRTYPISRRLNKDRHMPIRFGLSFDDCMG